VGCKTETRDIWVKTLKHLRESGETTVFTCVKNLPVTYTADHIILTISTKVIYETLCDNRQKLPPCVQFRFTDKFATAMPITQKLEKLFGDRVIFEYENE